MYASQGHRQQLLSMDALVSYPTSGRKRDFLLRFRCQIYHNLISFDSLDDMYDALLEEWILLVQHAPHGTVSR